LISKRSYQREAIQDNSEQTGTESEQNQNKRVLVLFCLGVVTLSLAMDFWENAPKNVPDHSPSTISLTEG